MTTFYSSSTFLITINPNLTCPETDEPGCQAVTANLERAMSRVYSIVSSRNPLLLNATMKAMDTPERVPERPEGAPPRPNLGDLRVTQWEQSVERGGRMGYLHGHVLCSFDQWVQFQLPVLQEIFNSYFPGRKVYFKVKAVKQDRNTHDTSMYVAKESLSYKKLA